MMDSGQDVEVAPLLCARCAVELRLGAGNFYEIHIEAMAEPTPPDLPDGDRQRVRHELEPTIEALRAVSPREAMDQVYRQMMIYLCSPCYQI